MTASAPSTSRPGRAVLTGRPVGVLWILLLAGLLTALPCAGHARAVTTERPDAPVAAPAGPLAGPPTGLRIASATAAAAVTGHRHHTATGPDGTPQTVGERVRAESHRHWTWCSVDGDPPHRDNGCSGHPYCAQDAQLPNPPPHPQPAAAPLPASPEAPPRVVPAGLLVGPHPAPDLHELQVHRS
ncbi:hypothetical protein [Kitasatospora sp. NBC_00458]|uniref:hypothetical protein n=1 Tax=Kitasatospora sp. NBC_00458 TaxID=2903568 RepID=UPI002E17C377